MYGYIGRKEQENQGNEGNKRLYDFLYSPKNVLVVNIYFTMRVRNGKKR